METFVQTLRPVSPGSCLSLGKPSSCLSQVGKPGCKWVSAQCEHGNNLFSFCIECQQLPFLLLVNDVLPAVPVSGIAKALPELDGPEEWNCAHLNLSSQHGKSSSLAEVHCQTPVADGHSLLRESLQWESSHVTSGPHTRQGGRHGGVNRDETVSVEIEAGNIVGNA